MIGRILRGLDYRALALTFAWLPVGAYSYFLNRIALDSRYFELVFEMSGGKLPYSFSENLFMFKEELLFDFVIVPVAIYLLMHRLGRYRLVRIVYLTLLVVLVLFLYANMHSWGSIGNFVTWTALVDALTFGLQNPQIANGYVELDSLAKLALLLASIFLAYGLTPRLARWRPLRGLMVLAALAIPLGAMPLVALGYANDIEDAPIVGDFLYLAGKTFLRPRESAHWPADVAPETLRAHFDGLTGTSRVDHDDTPYRGKARGDDLLVFVLETGSARFVDLAHDLDAFPSLKRLRPHALLALDHHTTFPATSEALFSAFASLYPPRAYYQSCVTDKERFEVPFSSFVNMPRAWDYASGIYLPYTDVVPLDKALHNNLGFDKIYYAQSHPREQGLSRDEQALREMKRDIARWIDQGRHYVAAFLPQLGHGPWGTSDHRRIVQRGRELAIRQDAWLGEILDLLEKKGRLEHTTILVFGDHGVRTRGEDPAFVPGFLDDYSFRVPLLLYSPLAFDRPLTVRGLTSHIDISPTLKVLYGFPEGYQGDQGVPLWSRGLERRNVYFFANWYFGADGYREGSQFLMYNTTLGAAFASDRLKFGPQNLLTDPARAAAVRDRIRDIYRLEQQWTETFLCRDDNPPAQVISGVAGPDPAAADPRRR